MDIKALGQKAGKIYGEWTRLRNAVYVCYPYARTAGATINDVNTHLANVKAPRRGRKGYARNKRELRRQFAEPRQSFSDYQVWDPDEAYQSIKPSNSRFEIIKKRI